MKGDVKGAFHHLIMHAFHVHRAVTLIPELNALVDLAAPFGWSGSPPFFRAFGRVISLLVLKNSPASVFNSQDAEHFFGYEWVDDHIMIEVVRADRLELADATLCHVMMATLGPRSINEAKFSPWSHDLSVLGLIL